MTCRATAPAGLQAAVQAALQEEIAVLCDDGVSCQSSEQQQKSPIPDPQGKAHSPCAAPGSSLQRAGSVLAFCSAKQHEHVNIKWRGTQAASTLQHCHVICLAPESELFTAYTIAMQHKLSSCTQQHLHDSVLLPHSAVPTGQCCSKWLRANMRVRAVSSDGSKTENIASSNNRLQFMSSSCAYKVNAALHFTRYFSESWQK